ncbi:hypothetical protein [Streptomyces sp. NBC_01508]|uniref:hypothetical protein n=1 Tax=Streptomyces sp. NBC_01508 TaxID=2903888 RepID=UPI003866ADDF
MSKSGIIRTVACAALTALATASAATAPAAAQPKSSTGAATVGLRAERAPAGPAVIQNKYRVDVRSGSCLRTFNARTTIAVGDCQALGGPSDSTSMRQWKAVAQPGGYVQLRSTFKTNDGKGSCLRTFNGITTTATGSCTAQGGTADFASMRLWKVVPQANGYVQLRSKYKIDDGKAPCLRVSANSTGVTTGRCTAQGGPYDYRSMRLWKSTLFPR